MTVANTSKIFYRDVTLPKIGEKQRKVFEKLKESNPWGEKDWTNSELANVFNVMPNRITGRTNELYKMELIENGPERYCHAVVSTPRKRVKTWKIKTRIEYTLGENVRQLNLLTN